MHGRATAAATRRALPFAATGVHAATPAVATWGVAPSRVEMPASASPGAALAASLILRCPRRSAVLARAARRPVTAVRTLATRSTATASLRGRRGRHRRRHTRSGGPSGRGALARRPPRDGSRRSPPAGASRRQHAPAPIRGRERPPLRSRSDRRRRRRTTGRLPGSRRCGAPRPRPPPRRRRRRPTRPAIGAPTASRLCHR